MVKDPEHLSEEERRALRGSKFAPLPSLPQSSSRCQPRLAHPGGPLATNKAAALAKFLDRKLKEPNGLSSINPQLVERAVTNAKQTVLASGTSNPERCIRHVDSFGDAEPEDPFEVGNEGLKENKKTNKKRRKKQKKIKKRMKLEDTGNAVLKKPKKLMFGSDRDFNLS